VALVQLVEHDGRHAVELRVGEQPAQEQPLGQEPEPRARAGHLVEADRVADGVAHPLAALGRDARGGEARGDAPWLEHPHLPALPPAGLEQRPRNAGRLSGPGRRLDDDGPLRARAGHDFGEHGVYRERGRQAGAGARR